MYHLLKWNLEINTIFLIIFHLNCPGMTGIQVEGPLLVYQLRILYCGCEIGVL